MNIRGAENTVSMTTGFIVWSELMRVIEEIKEMSENVCSDGGEKAPQKLSII